MSVFGFRRPKIKFFAPQITKNGLFWVQKNGTSDAQIQKRKIAYFRLIFGRFSLIKPQHQNPMLQSVNFRDKTLIFGIWYPYIQRQLDLSRQVTKMNFEF